MFSGFSRAGLGQQGQIGPAGPTEVIEDARGQVLAEFQKKDLGWKHQSTLSV